MPNIAERAKLTLVAAVGLAVLAAGPSGAQPLPFGPEIVVDGNATTCPAIAARDDGSFAVAWMTVPPDYERIGMAMRAGSLDGALGPKREVAVEAYYDRDDTRIAATPEGYAVVWNVLLISPNSYRPAFALLADRDGAPLAEPLFLGRPAIEISPRPVGGFVSHWITHKRTTLDVQLLDEGGVPSGAIAKLRVRGAYDAGTVHRSDGQFVVWWAELTPGTFGGAPAKDGGVLARRFDAAGRPLGKTFRLVPAGGDRRRLLGSVDGLRVAIAENGTLAAAWVQEPSNGRVGRWTLSVRAFDAAGLPLGPARQVAEADPRIHAAIFPIGLAVDAEGRALLAWMNHDGSGNASSELLAFGPGGGAAEGESFPLSPVEAPALSRVWCAAPVAVDDVWLVAWRADVYPTGSGFPSSRIVLRQFAR
jgi:hypothetical protein